MINKCNLKDICCLWVIIGNFSYLLESHLYTYDLNMTNVICLNMIIYMVLDYKINKIDMYYIVLKSPNNDKKI